MSQPAHGLDNSLLVQFDLHGDKLDIRLGGNGGGRFGYSDTPARYPPTGLVKAADLHPD